MTPRARVYHSRVPTDCGRARPCLTWLAASILVAAACRGKAPDGASAPLRVGLPTFPLSLDPKSAFASAVPVLLRGALGLKGRSG